MTTAIAPVPSTCWASSAYGALTAFERLAEDAQAAPTLADKVQLATVAARQINHFNAVSRSAGRRWTPT